ncbi:MAG: hypothetical protein ACFCUQ_12330 [Kiloniellales bacterium]
MRTLLPGLAVVALAGMLATGGLVRAQENEAEALYSRYHQAIEAAKQCRNVSFDQNAHDRMAAVISKQIHHSIGAKRLPLLTAAQRETRDIVRKHGCGDSRITELLALFDADLAPVL